MARGVNKCIFIGNLGKDPEVRYSQQGSAVAGFSIAVTESWKDKSSGEKVEKTEWVRCVAFNRLAEIIGQYLRKGAPVYIEGKFTTRKWQDKEGKDRYTTEIVVGDLQMLGSRESAQHDTERPEERPGKPADKPAAGGPVKPASVDFDDDIPF